jgi:hypothetical protein
MQKKSFLLSLAVAFLLCGCDRQTKLNTEKIEILSQRMVQLQESQAKQMAVFQTQLTALAPMLDRMNSLNLEKTHDDALFFHTNTLFLLLTVDKKIESHLQVVDAGREADSALAYAYHTNELDMIHSCVTQLEDALAAQARWIQDSMTNQEIHIDAETRKADADLRDELLKQIKLSAPDETEIARRKEMAADLVQIKRDLELMKLQPGQMTNLSAVPH